MSTTAILKTSTGQIAEIRHVDGEPRRHGGPIEFGQYSRDQDQYVSDRISRGEIIYHYTNLQALCGIVTEGKIWASDVRLMNDRTEVTYALEQMWRIVASDEENTIDVEVINAVFRPGRVWQFVSCFSRARD
jgi:hypothetical protein